MIYLCAAAALALASCSNDETVEMAKGDGISFRTVAGLNTRGAETVTDDLKTNGVWVTSFKEDGSIMYPETKYTESAGVWSAGQYWENETKLNFYLTYPEVKTWNAAKDFNLQNSKTITDFKVADAIKEQIDYVAAYVEANKTNAAIDADLQHILSQIVFKAKSSNKNYTYEISGVRIGKVNSTADYTFPTLTEKFGTFANLKDKKNYEYTFDAKTLNTATGEVSELTVADFGNAMLIPQTLTAWDGTKNGQDNTDLYFSIKVKLTFTFPSKPGKTVEKEVTLTSSLMVEYPTGSDIWYKLSQGSMSCHDLMTTDTPTLPDNADFATAIAKVVGANVTYSRELVATRMLNPDDNTQCFTYFGIRRATPDGSTIVVNLSRITLENYGGSTFDEKNFMTWNGTYYPVGSTWTVTKDNYDVKTHVDDMGMDVSVWQSTTMGDWGYDQAYGSGLFTFPGYYTIKNNKFGYYSIEKVSN